MTVTELDLDHDLVSVVRRRITGAYEIDEWGLDEDLLAVADPLLDVRFAITVDGAEHLPVDGRAVLVFNRRVGLLEPAVVLRAIRRSTGRTPRIVGLPDVQAVGPALRRFGSALDRPDEIAGLLRADQMVAIAASRSARRFQAGAVDPDLLMPAADLDAPVFPVAVVGREIGRAWRVVVGAPVPAPKAKGPLAGAELADEARAGLQTLLDEIIPPRWLLG